MKKSVMVFAFFAVSYMWVFVPAAVRAAVEPAGEEAVSFSNRDLEKYKSPADSTAAPATVRIGKSDRTARRDEQKDKAYWCSRAREYQKKIDRAKDEVKDSEKRASNDSGGTNLGEHKLSKSSRNKYEQAKKQLREAQRDLSYLEEEAHRRDIPPGWLRCQFE